MSETAPSSFFNFLDMRFVKYIIGGAIFFASVFPHELYGISVFNASDIMSSQKAGEPSNHTISFRSFSGINRGAIVFDFSNAVSSIGDVNYTDIDLSYGAETGEETQAALVTATGILLNTLSGAWRVSVNSAAKTITLLYPAVGGIPISSSDRVKIKIGTHARAQTQGDAQLVNAFAPARNIVIDILAGSDDGKIAIVLLADNSIGVTASQPIPVQSRSGSIAGTVMPQSFSAAQKSAPVKELRDISVSLPETAVPLPEKKEEKTIRPEVPINVVKQKKDTQAAQEQKLADRGLAQVSAPPPLSEKIPAQKQEQSQPVPIVQSEEQFAPLPPPSPESGEQKTIQEFQPIIVELAEPAVAVFAPQEKSATVSVKNSDGSGLTLNAEHASGISAEAAPVVFSVQPLAPQAAIDLAPDIVIEADTISIVGGIVYRVSAVKEDGEQAQIDGAHTMIFYYTDEQVFGLDENSLKAYSWDALGEQWMQEETSIVDTEKNSATIQATHFSLYALRAEKKPEEEQHRPHIRLAQAKKIIQEREQRLELGDFYLLDEQGNMIQSVDGVFSPARALYLRACVDKEKIAHKPRAVKVSFNGASSILSYDEKSGCSDALLAPRVLGVYPLVLKIIYYGTDAVDVVRARIAVVGDSAEIFAERKQNTAAVAAAVIIVSAGALYALIRRRNK